MFALHSEGFYALPYGFKMSMSLDLNCTNAGLSTHVAIFVNMMMREFDSALDWTLTSCVTLSIEQFPQLQPHLGNIDSQLGLLAFQRPTENRNYKEYG